MKTRCRFLLRTSQYIFLVLGLAALSYCGFALLDATLYQSYQKRSFEKIGRSSASTPAPLVADQVTRTGSPLGLLEIPSIGFSAVVLEGVDAPTLQRAVGHVPGTALPAQPGNVAIAGHRDTFFRPLRNIQKHDEITLTTRRQSYRYRVAWTEVVGPDDTHVLESLPQSTLTLITCYPFYSVGAAPKRFVVRADRIGE